MPPPPMPPGLPQGLPPVQPNEPPPQVPTQMAGGGVPAQGRGPNMIPPQLLAVILQSLLGQQQGGQQAPPMPNNMQFNY
jgi:hypothetical protein